MATTLSPINRPREVAAFLSRLAALPVARWPDPGTVQSGDRIRALRAALVADRMNDFHTIQESVAWAASALDSVADFTFAQSMTAQYAALALLIRDTLDPELAARFLAPWRGVVPDELLDAGAA